MYKPLPAGYAGMVVRSKPAITSSDSDRWQIQAAFPGVHYWSHGRPDAKPTVSAAKCLEWLSGAPKVRRQRSKADSN